MSNELTPMENAVMSYEEGFNSVNAYSLSFKKEANFALQLLKSSDFMRSTAQRNPDSLKNAITNIAAIGISLNPATKEAYLVPRSGSICLDISAIGLIKLATDSGSLKWVQAELVRENDTFKLSGVGKAPIHEADFFGDRGDIVGVYTVAKTAEGDYLTTVMSAKECHDIRDRSEAWKAFIAGKTKSCPWSTDEGEMIKKTCLKRASKLWPKSERLDSAVSILNEHEGIDFNNERGPTIDKDALKAELDLNIEIPKIEAALELNGKTKEGLLSYLSSQFKDESIKTIELNQLTAPQVVYAKRALGVE